MELERESESKSMCVKKEMIGPRSDFESIQNTEFLSNIQENQIFSIRLKYQMSVNPQ